MYQFFVKNTVSIISIIFLLCAPANVRAQNGKTSAIVPDILSEGDPQYVASSSQPSANELQYVASSPQPSANEPQYNASSPRPSANNYPYDASSPQPSAGCVVETRCIASFPALMITP
ncbi:MAG: hypothetical protein LBL04_13025 [Bacteroidales bacterium]|jgi:hypothetical protein|nr:hypothetical protein [Bacteroidales bacterium]